MLKFLFKSEKQLKRNSTDAIARALESGKPGTYFYSHLSEWEKLTNHDFIEFLRTVAPVSLNSYELTDIYERNGFISTDDVCRYIRNKLAERENDTPDSL